MRRAARTCSFHHRQCSPYIAHRKPQYASGKARGSRSYVSWQTTKSTKQPPPHDGGEGAQVEPIVQSVRQRGDAAVKELTQKFDGVALDTVCTPIAVRPSGHLPSCCSRIAKAGAVAPSEPGQQLRRRCRCSS